MSAEEEVAVPDVSLETDYEVDADFQRRFQMKLAQCTARGFGISECFAFLWQETLEEMNSNVISTVQHRQGAPRGRRRWDKCL